MSKLLNKILYYFGYAPIKVSHEVKYIYVDRQIDFITVKFEEDIDLNSSLDFSMIGGTEIIRKKVEEKLRQKVLLETSKNIEILWRKDEVMNTIRIRATLFIGKEKQK